MQMDKWSTLLGDEIVDANEETYDLFSQPLPSHDLGMVDPKARSLEVTIHGKDLEIVQLPGVLQSSRHGGTTGAVAWQSSLRLAEWLSWDKNPLLAHNIVADADVALELGSGLSGLVPCVLAQTWTKILATDQDYLLKPLQENIDRNLAGLGRNRRLNEAPKKKTSKGTDSIHPAKIEVAPLDWETDDVASFLRSRDIHDGVSLLVACDCVYNYALIAPFVRTCAEICQQRSPGETVSRPARPTICLIAQQLRQPEVFEQWLETFLQTFQVWRMPEDLVHEGFKLGSGFVLHLGILREGDATEPKAP